MTHKSKALGIALVLFGSVALVACDKKTDETKTTKEEIKQEETPKAEAKSPLEEAREKAGAFAALPKNWVKEGQTKEQEDLGRMLYYETRMSKNHDISCNSCHMLDSYGVDNTPTSTGHKKVLGSRNSPTVYNAAGHVAQFWDGRAKDVEEQAKGPILNPVEMAMPDSDQVEKVLTSIPGYVEAFKKAFPDQENPVNYENMSIAIGAFERNLATPAKWDKFLDGDDKALSEDELKGFNLFIAKGCVACHNGALVGGSTFQKVGAVKPWPNQVDQGVFEVSKKDTDKMMFKTPSLRNVEKTGPYFHDGSVKELDKAVKMMGEYQLGQTISDDEAKLIVAWLGSLTGEVDKDYVKKPELPENGPDTPAPDPN